MSDYISGVCNIGPAEIQQRKRVAIGGLFALIVSYISCVVTDAPSSTRMILFLPALIASVGFVQARRKFCLAFGFMGTFNFGKLGQLSKTQSAEEKSADRKTALSILGQSLVIAIVVTALLFFLPF